MAVATFSGAMECARLLLFTFHWHSMVLFSVLRHTIHLLHEPFAQFVVLFFILFRCDRLAHRWRTQYLHLNCFSGFKCASLRHMFCLPAIDNGFHSIFRGLNEVLWTLFSKWTRKICYLVVNGRKILNFWYLLDWRKYLAVKTTSDLGVRLLNK